MFFNPTNKVKKTLFYNPTEKMRVYKNNIIKSSFRARLVKTILEDVLQRNISGKYNTEKCRIRINYFKIDISIDI